MKTRPGRPGRTTGKFGSRSIAFRPKPHQRTYTPPNCWKGPFRFFDLPPELRDYILKIIILNWDANNKDIIHLFLSCQRIYAEAATIFYREVYLDNMHLRGTADPFLTGSVTGIAPRQYVQTLTIRFVMKDQIYLFGESYGTALREMVDGGKLQLLQLEIGSRFPNFEFWGIPDETFACDKIRVKGKQGEDMVILAPNFITKTPFQNFLKFLEEFKIPKTVYVDANDHAKFWCLFHHVHPSGERCGGEWIGNTRVLKIQWRSLVRSLKGAQLVEPTKDC
ncbi:uncharacterized protein GGS22DRAFT_172237 [Annulohypoxylon maeteangense]|uniref:uncharacterized protein n=1 Tax=Annulohypoxylon maeteangense TaxID=1927788 RepID=UPI0020081CE4|nr:uncharacterized protein GGS22DRAFT_172237 [Annulohypoxylon maeteangense]KAI0881470.1 hypothetical protein GGS22DRAFT_172237 [Annulohypoxylon maeteangense]